MVPASLGRVVCIELSMAPSGLAACIAAAQHWAAIVQAAQGEVML
jgi:hypothetical protein